MKSRETNWGLRKGFRTLAGCQHSRAPSVFSILYTTGAGSPVVPPGLRIDVGLTWGLVIGAPLLKLNPLIGIRRPAGTSLAVAPTGPLTNLSGAAAYAHPFPPSGRLRSGSSLRFQWKG